MKGLIVSPFLLLCILIFLCCGKNAKSDPIKNYGFTQNLTEYLLSNVDKAHEYVHRLGMSTLVTSETEELNDAGTCILVFLGTGRDDQFVREIHYAISEDGAIYEYDIIDDTWICVYSGQ